MKWKFQHHDRPAIDIAAGRRIDETQRKTRYLKNTKTQARFSRQGKRRKTNFWSSITRKLLSLGEKILKRNVFSPFIAYRHNFIKIGNLSALMIVTFGMKWPLGKTKKRSVKTSFSGALWRIITGKQLKILMCYKVNRIDPTSYLIPCYIFYVDKWFIDFLNCIHQIFINQIKNIYNLKGFKSYLA